MPDSQLSDNSPTARPSRSHTGSTMPGPYPRRQASFETPRQVPLPSPSQKQPDAQNYFSSLHLEGDAQDHTEPESDAPGVAARRKASDEGFDRFSSVSLPLPSQIPFYSLPRLALPPELQMAQSISPQQPPQDRTGARSSVADSISSSSSGSSSNSSSSSVTSSANTSSHSSIFDSKPTSSPLADSSSAVDNDACQPSAPIISCPRSQHAPRPISPFRAPQPPPAPPPQPTQQPTAMRRSVMAVPDPSDSFFPPPEPPTILPAENTHDPLHPSQRYQAPYAPFLSHAPPPPDSWIEIETTHSEYRLHVRLPGFSREGITLSTKRRRILHVVADSWENGGGHFERRISFGYDADLIQVRAEFDGIMLRITIPRRTSLVTWHSRTGSSTRT